MATRDCELTEEEWEIIQVVWEHEPCAAPTVQEQLEATKKWTYSTVKTLMDRMVGKGLLTTERIRNLTEPGGRLYQSRQAVIDGCAASAYLELQVPMGAMYAFPRVAKDRIPGFDDQAFAMELLEKQHVLIAPGSSFNVPYNDHFRLTTLPDAREMAVVFERMETVLQSMAG